MLAGVCLAVSVGLHAAPADKTALRYDLSLAEALRLASAHSHALSKARRGIEGARLQYETQKAAYLPHVDSNMGISQAYYGSSDPTDATDPHRTAAGLHVGITETIDISGRLRRQMAQARLNIDVAQMGYDAAANDLELKVRTDYINALRAKAHWMVDQQQEQRLGTLLNTARGLAAMQGGAKTADAAAGAAEAGSQMPHVESFSAGRLANGSDENTGQPGTTALAGTPDINALEIELSSAHQTMMSSETAMKLAVETLRQDLGLAEPSAIELAGDLQQPLLSVDADRLVAQAARIRPEIRQTDDRIQLARLAETATDDSRRPTLNMGVSSNMAVSGLTPHAALDGIGHGAAAGQVNDWRAKVELNIPLGYFDWGDQRRGRMQAALNRDQSIEDRVALAEQIGLEVRKSVIALDQAETRIKGLPDISQARQVLDAREKEYLTGKTTIAGLSNARTSLRTVQWNNADAYADYMVALANVEHALGARLTES